MFQQKKDPKNTKEFIYLRSVISSENVQILKVCVQSISQIRSHISSTLINVFSNISKKVVPVCIYC